MSFYNSLDILQFLDYYFHMVKYFLCLTLFSLPSLFRLCKETKNVSLSLPPPIFSISSNISNRLFYFSHISFDFTNKFFSQSKNFVRFLDMPVEFFISLYVLMTYEKHRKLNLRKTSKKLKFLEVPFYIN